MERVRKSACTRASEAPELHDPSCLRPRPPPPPGIGRMPPPALLSARLARLPGAVLGQLATGTPLASADPTLRTARSGCYPLSVALSERNSGRRTLATPHRPRGTSASLRDHTGFSAGGQGLLTQKLCSPGAARRGPMPRATLLPSPRWPARLPCLHAAAGLFKPARIPRWRKGHWRAAL